MNKDNKRFIVETMFLKEALKHDLTLNEFVILMYFDNEYELSFDVKKVSKAVCLDEEIVLMTFGTLLDKGLITLSSVKNENGKLIDKVSLENLYSGIKDDVKKSEAQEKQDSIYTKFQEGYAHSLSGMDFEIINGWLSAGFSEELILGALKEANYNGVSSLRYIDKILYEWKKKGFKSLDDVDNHLKHRDDNNEEDSRFETTVMEYNWLDED